MYEDSKLPEEPEEPKDPREPDAREVIPSKVDKALTFVTKYQTALACTFTGIIVYSVTKSSNMAKVEELETTIRRMRGQFDELDVEAGQVMEFIDHKNLREKYFAWLAQRDA